MKIYILDSSRNNRFVAPLKIFLEARIELDLDKLNVLKIKLARQVNPLIYDYITNNQDCAIRVIDQGVNLVFVRGNSSVAIDAQGIADITFFGGLYDITYKQVNYTFNKLVSGNVQDIISNIGVGYNFELVGNISPSIDINVGAMDNLNLFNEAMKRASLQWREIGVKNGVQTIQYGDFDFVAPNKTIYDYIRSDNYWNNNKAKIKSWVDKDNEFRYDYARFYVDKGSGTDNSIGLSQATIQLINYPIVNLVNSIWVQNGTTITSNNSKYITKVINIPDAQNLSTQKIQDILYNNAISFFNSSDDDEVVDVELESRNLIFAGDKIEIVLNKNKKQKRFTGTIRKVTFDLISRECKCKLSANPRKDLRNKNLALLYNIQNESYQKKYTPIN
jgi:hypothetical protein